MTEHIPEFLPIDLNKVTLYGEKGRNYLKEIKLKLMYTYQKELSALSKTENLLQEKKELIEGLEISLIEYENKAYLAKENSNFYFTDIFHEQVSIVNKKIISEKKKFKTILEEKRSSQNSLNETKQQIDIINQLYNSIQ